MNIQDGFTRGDVAWRGQNYTLTFWHRPLPAMISAFITAVLEAG
jgi:hypothetical protein